jgi:hypothetical protein
VASRGRQNADSALALALARGATIADAARAASVSERTAARRQANPKFQKRVQKLRLEMTARAAGRIADALCKASDTLVKLLSARSETVRLGACRALWEIDVRVREHLGLVQRIETLEADAGTK